MVAVEASGVVQRLIVQLSSEFQSLNFSSVCVFWGQDSVPFRVPAAEVRLCLELAGWKSVAGLVSVGDSCQV